MATPTHVDRADTVSLDLDQQRHSSQSDRRRSHSDSDDSKQDTDFEHDEVPTENANTGQVKRRQNATKASLSESKDKTQVTSTTSMAVIHVGILKAILDLGPHGMHFYLESVAFVIAAVVLQFLAGLISIYIATLKTYLSEHHGDFSTQCVRRLCPCKGIIDDSSDDEGYGFDVHYAKKNEAESSTKEKVPLLSQKSAKNRKKPYAEKVVHDYGLWKKESYCKQMEATNAATNIKWLQRDLSLLRARRQTLLQETKGNAQDPRIKDITHRIVKKDQQLELAVEKHREWVRFLERGDVLECHVDDVFEDRVLKSAAFWQNILNVIVFLVFALNSVITGFGLANVSNCAGRHE